MATSILTTSLFVLAPGTDAAAATARQGHCDCGQFCYCSLISRSGTLSNSSVRWLTSGTQRTCDELQAVLSMGDMSHRWGITRDRPFWSIARREARLYMLVTCPPWSWPAG